MSEENPMYELFGILKLGRVLRLSKIIQYMSVTEEIKASMKLIKMIFLLIIYIHCFACLWWLIVNHNQTWIPYKD